MFRLYVFKKSASVTNSKQTVKYLNVKCRSGVRQVRPCVTGDWPFFFIIINICR